MNLIRSQIFVLYPNPARYVPLTLTGVSVQYGDPVKISCTIISNLNPRLILYKQGGGQIATVVKGV